MMESRSCYGYYGEGHGATGETNRRKEHYELNTYYFLVDWHLHGISNKVDVKAKNFKNAERNVKAWAKRDGGTYLGVDPDYSRIMSWYMDGEIK